MPSAFDPVLDDAKEQEQKFFDDPIEESQKTVGGPPGLFGTAGTSSSKEEQVNNSEEKLLSLNIELYLISTKMKNSCAYYIFFSFRQIRLPLPRTHQLI
jgi:hypothetical protein